MFNFQVDLYIKGPNPPDKMWRIQTLFNCYNSRYGIIGIHCSQNKAILDLEYGDLSQYKIIENISSSTSYEKNYVTVQGLCDFSKVLSITLIYKPILTKIDRNANILKM